MIEHLRPFLATTVLLLFPTIAHTQTYQPTNRTPVADTTLGTQVSENGNNFNITGGVGKGHTLFHSFTDFSVPTNGAANFLNPVGNRDIITRVTGNVFSDINGLVNTNGANFFLINPNGIVFGTNARLNVGKAFVGSTANSLDLVDGGGRTITFGTNVNGDAPLLSVAPNVLFDVSRLNFNGGTGAITNFGTLQTPNNSQYIGLIGGNVTLDGSTGGGKIVAPGGRVDVGGLSGAGSVTVDNNGLVFSSIGVGRSDVLLTDGAGITVRATGTLDTVNTFFNNATANGSSLNISANNLALLNAGAISNTLPAAIDAGLETDSGVQIKAAGDINIDATGKVSLNSSAIKNTLRTGAEGSIGDINIQAGALDVNNNSIVSSATLGKGNAGDINIQTTGDIKMSGYDPVSSDRKPSNISIISSDTQGQGDAGQININTQGKLFANNQSLISSTIAKTAVGNGKDININARELELANQSSIVTDTSQGSRVDGKGNAGNINIKTSGDIKIAGYDSSLTNPTPSDISIISGDSQGYGNAGKITVDTQGKLFLVYGGGITSLISNTGVGSSQGIAINARELELANNGTISTLVLSNGRGNAGDINIKTTGDIKISGRDTLTTTSTSSDSSYLVSNMAGLGDAGQITIVTQGKLSILNRGLIASSVGDMAVGNSKGIKISARELELANNSLIFTSVLTGGRGNAGNIDIKTTGDIKIAGYDLSLTNSRTSDFSGVDSSSGGQGDAEKITIDTQGKLSLINNGIISSAIGEMAIGNSKGIGIVAREVELNQTSFISTRTAQTTPVTGKGKAGDIDLQVNGTTSLNNSAGINTRSFGVGASGNVSIDATQLLLNNGGILSSADSASGGNVILAISDLILINKNGGFITTNSGSGSKSGNGGNITITSPSIIALPGNNDITANAYNGAGGQVNITSQGLFGIQYRAKGSPLTNDITASSTFGQSGAVNISTPGVDPGRDSTELPKVTTDASKQISQVCGAGNRQNKLTVAGRGGLPPNANDPLTSDVVWQDVRAVSSQPAVSSATPSLPKFAPPAVGWVFDGKGKVLLIAAGTQGQPTTGTSVVCPNVVTQEGVKGKGF